MSEFKVNLTAINPVDRSRQTPPVEVLVDTGAYLSCLPKQLLLDAGITPEGKKRFSMANKQIIERDYGYAILAAEGYETNGEVIFAEKSDKSLLGVTAIEGFGVMVSPTKVGANVGQRFVDIDLLLPTMTLVDWKAGSIPRCLQRLN